MIQFKMKALREATQFVDLPDGSRLLWRAGGKWFWIIRMRLASWLIGRDTTFLLNCPSGCIDSNPYFYGDRCGEVEIVPPKWMAAAARLAVNHPMLIIPDGYEDVDG